MKKVLVSFLTVVLTSATTCPLPALAQSVYGSGTLDGLASLESIVNVPGGGKKLNVSATNENIRTIMRQIAQQGGFNLMMDPSITGNISAELNNVTVNQALQSVAELGDLVIIKQNGGIYLAITKTEAHKRKLDRQLSKVIKVYYSNASRIAEVLNESIFKSADADDSTKKAAADARTNSLILVGTPADIKLAEETVSRLDIPRQSKTFYLSHANAVDVAGMLSSTIYNDGTNLFASGSAGADLGTNVPSKPSSVRVDTETTAEGSGINDFGSTGEELSGGLGNSVTLRGVVKSTKEYQVSPQGPLVIPDTRQNSVTIMGTAEQIAMAESLIPTLDAQLPQVSIEVSLIEITESGVKELRNQIGIADGRTQMGFNNTALAGINPVTALIGNASQPAGTGLIGLPTVDPADASASAGTGIMITTEPLATNKDYLLQVQNLVTKNKARVLANPTVVATHDSESIISIVDEIISRVTATVDAQGTVTSTPVKGNAGIVLDILPKIGEDGTVNLRVRPSVTSVIREGEAGVGNLFTLLNKRDMMAQNVRVRDGETLVIGGLIQETDRLRTDKVPLIGDLPIVGAMFRASNRQGRRSELVLMITPHILGKAKLTPVHSTAPGALESSMAGGEK